MRPWKRKTTQTENKFREWNALKLTPNLTSVTNF